MGKQFEDVWCRYGAPMGRKTIRAKHPPSDAVILLFKVRVNKGGYDDGGAYWGIGDAVYCARDMRTQGGEYRDFCRARSREKARQIMQIPQEQLARPTKITEIMRRSGDA